MLAEAYQDTILRLSKHSVRKHFDAYADIDWDAPENQIDPHDPRWERTSEDPLGATLWYRTLPQATRAQLGLHMIAQQMKVGIAFEGILMRGLLEFASVQEDRSPALRYALHEVIEESQHSLMFQEFINRAGLPVRGLSGLDAFGARMVPRLGRVFPELFFLFVLGGEEPIDCSQRDALENSKSLHPLFERIMRIHVMEEARHLCFARTYLEEHVPRLGALRTLQLRIRAPIIFSVMARQMLEPPRSLAAAYGMPREVLREAYYDNPQHKSRLMDNLARVRSLCAELNIASPGFVPLWQRLGIWA